MASYGISQIKINEQQKLFSSKIIGIRQMAFTVLYQYLEEYINGYYRSKSRILIFLGILIVSQANAAELKMQFSSFNGDEQESGKCQLLC